jgi:hypothetical protein
LRPWRSSSEIYGIKSKVVKSENLNRTKSYKRKVVVTDYNKNKEWESFFRTIDIIAGPISSELSCTFLEIKRLDLPSSVYSFVEKISNSVIERCEESEEEPYDVAPVSIKSLNRLLHLTPMIYLFDPSVSLDSRSGLIKLTFKRGPGKLLNVIIEEKNEFIYSLVKKTNGIVKNSGTFTIVDDRDMSELSTFISYLK